MPLAYYSQPSPTDSLVRQGSWLSRGPGCSKVVIKSNPNDKVAELETSAIYHLRSRKMTKSEALGPLSSLVWGSGGPGLIGMSCQNRCLALYWEYPGQSPMQEPSA